LISDITDLEAYVNTRGFLRYLTDKKVGARGETVTVGLDLRPSTPRIAQAVAQACHDEGVLVENVGQLPSPALLSYALGQGRASVMVTGSHIPFDRNGIKFNMKAGEVLKEDEPGILGRVLDVRSEEYNRPPGESVFNDTGFFLPNRAPALPPKPPPPERRIFVGTATFSLPRVCAACGFSFTNILLWDGTLLWISCAGRGPR
jgi:phosphomannomutase